MLSYFPSNDLHGFISGSQSTGLSSSGSSDVQNDDICEYHELSDPFTMNHKIQENSAISYEIEYTVVFFLNLDFKL